MPEDVVFEVAFSFKLSPDEIIKWKYYKILWYYMYIKKKEILESEKNYEYIKIMGAFINPSIASELKKGETISESFDPFLEKTLEDVKNNLVYG